MTNDQPRFYETYGGPAFGTHFIGPNEERATAAAASREAVKEEMARQRALGRPPLPPPPELPPIKAPTFPDNFAQSIAALDGAIYKRGLAVDADRLMSLGKKRFAQLLAAARDCRSPREVRAQDLSAFAQVQNGIENAFEAVGIPRRKTIEQLTGAGIEREAARQIKNWPDLWKAGDPDPVRRAYFFHDRFMTLCFGQSMLERLSPDGRLRSRLLCGGRGPKVELFRQWLAVTTGPLVRITLSRPLVRLFAWLADEKAEPPKPVDLAREWSGLRVPSKAQVRQAEAVVEDYLLGYHNEWSSWEYVGRQTRTVPDRGRLGAWRKELAKALPRITAWQAEVKVAFYRDVGRGWESYKQFEAARYRAFIERLSRQLLDQAGALLALGIAENATVAARFQDCVFVEAGKDQLKPEIGSLLQAAFPNSNFQVEVAEVQHE